MVEKSSLLTFVVPTRNRVPYLVRLFSYWRRTHNPYSILLGDSSDPVQLEEGKKLVAEFGRDLQITHVPFDPHPHYPPGKDTIECLSNLMALVKTPLAVFHADDDYVLIPTVDKCVEFMLSHPDYSSACGKAVLLATKSEGTAIKVEGGSRYLQKSVEHNNAFDRLRNSAHTEFSIKRTEHLRESWKNSNAFGFDAGFGEIYANYVTMVQGKSKRFDDLYMVRLAHESNTARKQPDMFDWVFSDNFTRQMPVFLNSISEMIVSKENIPSEDAFSQVKQAFWAYLSQGLVHKYHMAYGRNGEFRQFRRRLATNIPKIRSGWLKVRSYFPGEANELSLEALLRKRSPHHRIFKDALDCITDPKVLHSK
ncbi:MAG: hypothetical protein KCHDKBKB_01140 [Elusimicrobia bacterium]|nr:hypothetical protein [Elusimicrobiota bacterium]